MRLSIPSALVVLTGLLAVGDLQAQSTRIVPVEVKNNGSDRDTLRFGLADGATYGIDQALGEIEYPPFPPTDVFEARLVNIPNRPPASPGGLGEGVKLDLRPVIGEIQTDTFRIKFQSGAGGYPVTISWSNDLSDYAKSLIIRGGGNTVDMLTATSFVVTDPDVTVATIIRQDDPVAGVDNPGGDDMGSAELYCTPVVVSHGESVLLGGSALRGARSIEIFDATGSSVRNVEPTATTANGTAIRTDGLPGGSYHILIRSNRSTSHTSFVVLD